MNDYGHIFRYLHQVDSYLLKHQQLLNDLQEEVKSLQSKINQLQERQITHIDKIEYKFDQLKIERLEGTLNIGLTPQGLSDPETIENFAVGENLQGELPIMQQYPNFYTELKNEVRQYLNIECHQFIDECAHKYNKNISDKHRTFIIQDIERQLDGRLHYYINQMAHSMRDANIEEMHSFVLSKIKRDIQNAIDAFIQHMPTGGHDQ
ncbi:spore germination protein GerPC [Calidifontibacillus erzurumensis]|uniref:Spore gernimation protein GerPC n=1 Tax=Calidifontibacillus erzurumensis TaxID=2741433 RepID=A0A8J8GG70_9BACI|nr:spore germination protein GerPC [Calidifontibacillus erzurumensis]NSL53057.1 spore gernimation protein GerPC [Calidifontibacillus erzurumensis]